MLIAILVTLSAFPFFALLPGCHRRSPTMSDQQRPPVVDLVARYHAGERWRYRTRSGEEASTLTVLRIDTDPRLGVIVHVAAVGLRMRSPRAQSGFANHISHMPFAQSAIDASVTERIESDGGVPDFEEGYRLWRTEFDRGRGGVFTIPVSEAIAGMEHAMNP